MGKKIKNLLNREIYVREIVVLFILVISLLFIGVFTSLAVFENGVVKENVVTVIGGEIYLDVSSDDIDYNNETDEITINSSTTKYIDLTIKNNTPTSVKYKLYYELVDIETLPEGVNIGITDTSINNGESALDKDKTKIVRVGISNTSESNITFKIGIIGGFANNELELSTGTAFGTLIETGDNISISGLTPISESDINTNGYKKTITLTNDITNDINADIYLRNIVAPNLKSSDVKWALYEGTDNTGSKVTNGTMAMIENDGENIILFNNALVEANSTKNYTLYVWIENNGVDQSALTGTLTGLLTITKKSNETLVINDKYQPVEYLESTGQQCIETNINTDTITSIKVETDILFNNNLESEYKGFLGSYQMVGIANRLQLIIPMSPSNTIKSNGFHMGYSTSCDYKGTVIWDEKVYIEAYAENGTQYLKQNGTIQFSSNYTGSLNTGSTIGLFRGKIGAEWSPNSTFSGKLYTCKITIDGMLVRNFIPCYDIQTNKPGLYDTVNNTFYANAGTDEFLVGKDI